MNSNHTENETPERRSEERTPDERYYSVQFTTETLSSFYQFKLWNISAGGMCILVKEDSELLKHLAVDDILEMTYYIADSQGDSDNLKTKIIHITKNENGRFQGHCLVGLSIL